MVSPEKFRVFAPGLHAARASDIMMKERRDNAVISVKKALPYMDLRSQKRRVWSAFQRHSCPLQLEKLSKTHNFPLSYAGRMSHMPSKFN
jgi:hypothetical protein